MNIPIYDKEGNIVGYKTQLFPSGEWVVTYPKRLQDNILVKKGLQRR